MLCLQTNPNEYVVGCKCEKCTAPLRPTEGLRVVHDKDLRIRWRGKWYKPKGKPIINKGNKPKENTKYE